ncbi:MAG TPA: sigma-70 family RNA polymerase sigma factor [Kofleriaceae bacterium]|nr:sigma-70 family RNA polymerase sigma factor [Kofleriaceae bacterium]
MRITSLDAVIAQEGKPGGAAPAGVARTAARPAAMGSIPGPERMVRTEDIRRGLVKAVGRVCPPWLSAHRDDLVQSAMLRILEIRNRDEADRTFSASYLRKVAHAVLVDEIRRLRHRSEVPLAGDSGAGGDECDGPSPRVTDPERRLQDRQLGQVIGECLRTIKTERRQALVLFLEGHSVPEAARILGWGHKKTENVIFRGRADLRRRLELMGVKP